MIVQPRLHRAHMLAEAQHDAEFFGLDAEEAGQAQIASAPITTSAIHMLLK